MPGQRTGNFRAVYNLPDDSPKRLVRFQEGSSLPWSEIVRSRVSAHSNIDAVAG